VVLADPHGVNPERFGIGHFVEEVPTILLLGAVFHVVIEEGHEAEFHHVTTFGSARHVNE
jgi:hypothetical protein